MKRKMHYLSEAFLLGIMTLIIGLILGCVYGFLMDIDLKEELRDPPKKTLWIMTTLFSLGFVMHLMCEITGLNKMYCDYGYACVNPNN